MSDREIYNLTMLTKHACRIAPRGEGRNYRGMAARGLIHRSALDHRWRITPAGVEALRKAAGD